MATNDEPNPEREPVRGNLSVTGASNVATASASHPDPSQLSEAERRHLGIE